VVWVELNDEQRAVERALDAAGISYSSLYGSQAPEEREQLLDSWRNRETTVFLSKPSMYGAGVNLQQCHRMIFTGITYKFHEVIQGVHRVHRFLQEHPVQVDLIYTEGERSVRDDLKRKWRQHDELVARMGEIIRGRDLARGAVTDGLTRSAGIRRREVRGDSYLLANNDSVEECAAMDDGSAGLIVTSIPFSTQYEYTPSYNDFGHSEDNDHFWQQMDFLTPELFRVLQPGRIAAIHVKDRIAPGGLTGLGFQTLQPFHAEAIRHYMKHGLAFMAMITVVTDVVRENNQTYRLGWTENSKDGTKMGAGVPEYVLVFRKPPTDSATSYADEPVRKAKRDYSRARWQVDAHGFWRSSGNRPLLPEEFSALSASDMFKKFRDHHLASVYDYGAHVAVGEHLEDKARLPSGFMLLQPPSHHPEVWTDVARMRTLNMMQERKGQQQHLCPLPFDIVERLIERYSMPGETVLDPFMGIGTVPMVALKTGRRGIGIELNARYFGDAAGYCAAEAQSAATPTLFDLLDAGNDPQPSEPDSPPAGPTDGSPRDRHGVPGDARNGSEPAGSTGRRSADSDHGGERDVA
jgi:DNA modification methylase